MGYGVQSGVVVGKRVGEYHASQNESDESMPKEMTIF
jgi:hypothetical protein